ncbi:CCC motif membrane protein [Flavobacterium sp. 3HN19-14]|uniref:CCC motif membrane protein n=1 Tax=Flavobacterium sp. 3HN19-14 TaxID=3448133 RepID=UPI003EE22CB8
MENQILEKQKLPNATAVLVLGILSIVTCCCYGIFGLLFSIIALVLAKKDMKLYQENPELYSNYKNLNTGRIISIVGLVLSIVFILYVAFQLYTLGWDGMQAAREEFMRAYTEAQQKQKH